MLKFLSDKTALLSNFFSAIERVLCAVLISAFTVILMINVLSRYLFDSPIFFAEELALLILVWMGYLAIAYSISLERQIGMGLVVDSLPEPRKRIALIAVDVIMLAISCVLLWSTIQWLQSSSVEYDRAIALDWPKRPFYWIIPVFWTALIIHVTHHLLRKLAGAPEPA